jgi:nucleoside-diphosphate-sugar epimerase
MCIYAADGSLPPLADPWVVRDFIYVDDIVDAYVAISKHDIKPGSIYNIGTGNQTTLAELADLFIAQFRITQAPVFGTYETRAWDTRCWVSESSAALRDLNWAPTTPLQHGVDMFASWISEHHDSYPGRAEHRLARSEA